MKFIGAITVQSDSGRRYEISQGQDGAWVCSCPAWRFQQRPGASRSCKHLEAFVLSAGNHVVAALAVAHVG
jgi:hypothetical protein